MAKITQRITNMCTIETPSRLQPSTFETRHNILLGEYPNFGNELNTISVQANSLFDDMTVIENTILSYQNTILSYQNTTQSYMTSTENYKNTASELLSDALSVVSEVAENKDYVATQAAFVASLYALVGIGVDSDGILFAEINEASNVSNMAIDSNGQLIVTYS